MADGGGFDIETGGGWAPADPDLVACLPATMLLSHRVLPWRRQGAETVVLCCDPVKAAAHLTELRHALGQVRLLGIETAELDSALARDVGRPLATAAEGRAPPWASCRTLPRGALVLWAAATSLVVAAASSVAPLAALATACLLAALTLVLSSLLKLLALTATLRRLPEDGAESIPLRLPVLTVFVPLYRERAVAHHLLDRMAALDYPRDRLDLCLLLEEGDVQTRSALNGARWPSWARVIEVPEGTLRTKPRALNYGLNFAKGTIIGIYDAEDLPSPDHLRRVALVFARRDSRTACLQGALDYFNADRNWLSRCFTLEYAMWFRVLLPGFERLGLVVPLGGTTLFLRRDALEAVGAWDAHNVTEDADLGVRLARAGYRTEVIPIVTMEEANARLWPWVRQRSRWLKGYALTYAVHMRAPGRLWRELGPGAFLAFQVQFAGTLVLFALAPLLWSFVLVPLGLPHPLAPLLPPWLLVALSILFLAAQVLDLAIASIGARRARRPGLAIWALTLQFYFPLATAAAYRALWEVARHPFRWDKTVHGIDQPVLPPGRAMTAPAPWPRRA